MIKYIQDKNINYDRFCELTTISQSTNQFTNNGPCKTILEEMLRTALDLPESKRVVCVANGTLALHSIYLKYGSSFRWASPSLTFPSVIVGGFDCDILDIDIETYTIDISDSTLSNYDGVIITNLFGTYPKNILKLIERCKALEKVLVFDNASSPLTKINNINICSLGDVSFGSLHHTKIIGFGEGGFIVCDADEYDEYNRSLGFGFRIADGNRVFSRNSSNFKMSDVTAASIIQHLESFCLDEYIEVQNYLIDKIKNIKGVDVFNYSDGVVLGNLCLIFDRPVEKSMFSEAVVEVQKYYLPIKNTKNAMNVYSRLINMPLNTDISIEDADIMIDEIARVSRLL